MKPATGTLAIFLSGVTIIFYSAAFAGPPPTTDLQLWTELDVRTPITATLGVTALLVDRVGIDVPNPALVGGGVIIDNAVGHGWSLTAGDIWVRVRSASSGTRVNVQLPLAAATYSWNISSFIISDRSRGEDVAGLPGDHWRYRNRLGITDPISDLGPLRNVFVSDEVFYDVGLKRWSRNRAQIGITLQAIDDHQLQVYYIRQDDRSGHPSGINGIGVAMLIDLE